MRLRRTLAIGPFALASVRTTYVVLACAHLDHDPGNNAPANLAALCQRCHMRHDAAEHRWQRWWNVFRQCAIRDLFDDPRLSRRRDVPVAARVVRRASCRPQTGR